MSIFTQTISKTNKLMLATALAISVFSTTLISPIHETFAAKLSGVSKPIQAKIPDGIGARVKFKATGKVFQTKIKGTSSVKFNNATKQGAYNYIGFSAKSIKQTNGALVKSIETDMGLQYDSTLTKTLDKVGWKPYLLVNVDGTKLTRENGGLTFKGEVQFENGFMPDSDITVTINYNYLNTGKIRIDYTGVPYCLDKACTKLNSNKQLAYFSIETNNGYNIQSANIENFKLLTTISGGEKGENKGSFYDMNMDGNRDFSMNITSLEIDKGTIEIRKDTSFGLTAKSL